jgi:predicted RNA-binding Zn-ribbon protein involved in translation (DUF1610 family)
VSGFDRVRPRSPEPEDTPDTSAHDAEGKRALFSSVPTPVTPQAGAVVVECSSCGEETPLTLGRLVRASVPSLHLPLLRKDHPSWLRCPACGRRTWVSVRFRA